MERALPNILRVGIEDVYQPNPIEITGKFLKTIQQN